MSFRLWIGLWTALILFILVAVDASALVCYITRFTEENFATLIAFIFIIKVSHFFLLFMMILRSSEKLFLFNISVRKVLLLT